MAFRVYIIENFDSYLIDFFLDLTFEIVNIKQQFKYQLSNLVLFTCADHLLLNVRMGGFLLNISRPGRYILVIVGITCHFQLTDPN